LTRPVRAGFVADKVALRRVFLRVLMFQHVSSIPPMPLHSYFIQLTVTL